MATSVWNRHSSTSTCIVTILGTILAAWFEEDTEVKFTEAKENDQELKEENFKRQQHDKLKKIMDEAIDEKKDDMKRALEKNDTTAHWTMWSRAVERAFAKFWEVDTRDKNTMQQYKGRGKVVLQKAKPPRPEEVAG